MHLGGLAMELTKYKLGELIELVLKTNSELRYGPDDVRGMTITKEIIPTKADVTGTDLSKFLVVSPGEFIYNPRTHGKRIGFGYNNTDDTFIISWNNIAFKVKASMKDVVLADYLFLHFKRDEWDREACFQSWGSSTEVFSWEALCDMEVDLPPLPIQQKYVDIYNAMLANQQSYERGLEDLKLVCDAYIENLANCEYKKIGDYIERNKNRNQDNKFTVSDVKGFNNDGLFIEPMRLFSGDITTFKIVTRNDFVYNSRINSTIKKLSIVINEGEDLIVSPAYESFRVCRENELSPFYLYLLLQRESFARKVLFNSFGSSTIVFGYDDLSEIEIPVPDFTEQVALANIYRAYKERWGINEKLKAQIKDICPILIKGSIEEARKIKEA